MSKDELLYELIFSEKTMFSVDVNRYIFDIYKYDDFIQELKKILIQSKVLLVEEDIEVDNDGKIIWKIKLKR